MSEKLAKFQSLGQRLRYTKIFRAPEYLYRRVFHKTHNRSGQTVDMRLGHKIELVPSQPYLERVVTSRSYHDEDVFFLDKFLPANAVILDIGANIGLLSCAYASYYMQRKPLVYAVEAIERNFDQLNRNIRLNNLSNVRAFRIALGEQSGTLKFRLPTPDFMGNAVGNNVLSKADDEQSRHTNTYEEEVPLSTLDQWTRIMGIERCDFLKIDIEGAELGVFRGGREFISKTRPVIQSEFNYYWLQQQGIGLTDFLDFFKDLGYVTYVEDGDRYLKLRPEEFRPKLVDLLFVPEEKISSIAASA